MPIFAFGDVHPLLASLECSFTFTELSEFIHPPVVGCITPPLVLARFHQARSATHEVTAMIQRPSVGYTKYTKCQACRRRRCITPHLHGPSQLAQTAVMGTKQLRHVDMLRHVWYIYTLLPQTGFTCDGFLLHLTSGPGGVGLLGSSVFLFHGSGCLELSLPAALAAFGCIWLSGVAMVAWIAFFSPAASGRAGFCGLQV